MSLDLSQLGELSIHFDQIQVNAIDSSSGIFVGTNTQWNWMSSSKNNAGLGEFYGDLNKVHHNINTIYDNDFIDAPTTKGDLILGSR